MQTVYDAFLASAKAAPAGAFLCVPDIAPGGSKDTPYKDAAAAIESLRAAYAGAGYGHGHRVALLLGQSKDFVFHYLALNGLGCTIVPVNPDYRHDEMVYLIDHSESDIAVCKPDRVKDLVALEKDLKRSFPVIDVTQFNQQLPKAARKAPLAGAPTLESIHSILYTSGTTGRPKGCMLSNDATLIAGAWYRDLGGVLTIFPGKDRLYNPSPFYHVNNLTVGLRLMFV
jgi:crotonobetaine/carnitine-CoA ligase